jgi:hypothetical protein
MALNRGQLLPLRFGRFIPWKEPSPSGFH